MGTCSHPALFFCFVNGPATSATYTEHDALPVVPPLFFIYPAAPGENGLNQAASGPFLGHHSHTVAAYMSTRCVPIFLYRWPAAPGAYHPQNTAAPAGNCAELPLCAGRPAVPAVYKAAYAYKSHPATQPPRHIPQ